METEKEQKKEFTGVWIPKHVIEDLDLSPIEKIIYAEISCFEVCYMKNEQLGKRYGRSERTISAIINKLKARFYVEETIFNGRMRGLVALKDSIIARQTRRKSLGRPEENFQAEQKKTSTKDNNKENKLENNLSCELSSQIHEIFDIFYKINPVINWGNKTSRNSAEFLIKKFGFDGTKKMAEQIVGEQGKDFCPVATTPHQMKEKLAQFKIYFDRLKNAKNNKIKIATISKEDWDAL